MSYKTDPRRNKNIRRVVAATGVAAVAGAGAFIAGGYANAAPSTVVTITAVSPHLVAALTANQVISITGTGFDESVIASVAINGCTTGSYIVGSATSLLFKTDNSCATSSTGVITITDTSGNTAVSVPGTAAQKLAFVAAPTIATPTASLHPVVTENTSGLAYAAQTTAGTSASTKGGTVIRVTSGTNPFVTSAATPFSASLDGVPLTSVAITGSSAGNYFTGVVGAHAADAAPTLKITNNGVSKTFVYGAALTAGLFDFTYGGSSITIAPAFGAANGGNKLTITGTGFSTTTASDVVTVGTVACPVVTATTTSITCTVPAAITPFSGPVTVKVAVTGGLTSVVGAGNTYTYLAQ